MHKCLHHKIYVLDASQTRTQQENTSTTALSDPIHFRCRIDVSTIHLWSNCLRRMSITGVNRSVVCSGIKRTLRDGSALEVVTSAAYRSCGRSINLDLHHLSFNDLCLLSVEESHNEYGFISNNENYIIQMVFLITHLILTPMAFLKAWLSDSVLLISREKISLPAIAVKGVSGPRDWAMPAYKM